MNNSAKLAVTLVLLIFLEKIHVLRWLDFFVRVILAEFNRKKSFIQRPEKSAQRLLSKNTCTRAVACVVGYRENPYVFRSCLRSYIKSPVNIIVVGIDGDEADDQKMVHIFKEVFSNLIGHVLSFDVCIGELVTAHLNAVRETKCGLDKGAQDPRINESFIEAYNYIKKNLEKAGLWNHQDELPSQLAICFTEPHCDLKAIRFSAWLIGIVLAECYGIDFIWSSDSDTIILPDTIPNITRAMARNASIGGASAVVCVHNSHDSMIAKLATVMFALNTYLNRAALGALGQSDCLMGPSAAFRVDALRQMLMPWYCYRVKGSKVVVNEDVQMTVLLGKNQWCRGYCQDSLVFTAVPTTAQSLLGQKMRWARAGHLDRIFEASFIISQNPLYLWHSLRISFYDVLVCIWIGYYAATGLKLYTLSFYDLFFLEIFPPLYNFLRSPESLPSLPTVVLLQLVNRLITPFFWTYALFTLFDDTWTISSNAIKVEASRQKFKIVIQKETLFFFLWTTAVFIATSRGICSILRSLVEDA